MGGSQGVRVQAKSWGPGEGWGAGNDLRRNRHWGPGWGLSGDSDRQVGHTGQEEHQRCALQRARQPELWTCLNQPSSVTLGKPLGLSGPQFPFYNMGWLKHETSWYV